MSGKSAFELTIRGDKTLAIRIPSGLAEKNNNLLRNFKNN
jgi:hypothetical protein